MKQFLMVLAGYKSTGIWSKFGHMLSPLSLPLSYETKKDLKDWCNEYDATRYVTASVDESDRIDNKGLQIAKRVKYDLPTWIVLYWNKKTSRRLEYPRGEYMYYAITKNINGLSRLVDYPIDRNGITFEIPFLTQEMEKWFFEYADIGDTIEIFHVAHLTFKNPKIAVLFKLTWL